MPLRVNLLKEKLKAGRTVIGACTDESRGAGPLYVMADAGIDFVWIDMEHNPLSMETVADLIAHAHGAGITPVVRPPEATYPWITRLLDAGCQSLFIPGVTSAADVRRVRDLALYGPLGHRGMGIYGNAGTAYVAPEDFKAAAAWANEQLLLGLMIETTGAVEELDDVLSEGVDFATLGWMDLTQDFGLLGEESAGSARHPSIDLAEIRLQEACRSHGVAYLGPAANETGMRASLAAGSNMLICGGVFSFVRSGVMRARQTLDALRA